MNLIFMGTGTSQGVPMIAQPPGTFNAAEPRNFRTRSSVHLECGGRHYQVDVTPDFRAQCLREDLRRIDEVILTHGHADHILGMDDLRRFCDLRNGGALPVYADAPTLERVRAIFPYAAQGVPAQKGYPAFDLHLLPSVLEFEGGRLESVELPHGPISTRGLIFTEYGTGRRCAYYSDCHALTREAVQKASGADCLVIDGLRPGEHPSHMSLTRALEAIAQVGARRSYLTHMTYQMDYALLEGRLPPGVHLAYDGLRLAI